jgi:hypothetical protein
MKQVVSYSSLVQFFFGVMNYGSIEYLAIGTMRMRLLIFTETDHMQ